MSLTTRMSALVAAVLMSTALFAVNAQAADDASASAAASAPAAAAPAASDAAAPAAAPAADAPAAPAVVKEEVANPYGPQAVWTSGDFVDHRS